MRSATGVEGDDRRQTLAETGDEVDFGQRGREFVAVALGHAAGDDESRARTLDVGEREDGLDGLLARRFDERAGIGDHEVGAGSATIATV